MSSKPVRPNSAIVAFGRDETVLRRLALRWGVIPIRTNWVEGVERVIKKAEEELLRNGLVEAGDDIVVTFGLQDMNGPGRTDMLKLWRVRPPHLRTVRIDPEAAGTAD